jgi:hypothetical protein
MVRSVYGDEGRNYSDLGHKGPVYKAQVHYPNNSFIRYVYSGINKTTCFGLFRGHLQVLQVLAIGD